jgi:hypothetical protein
MRFAFSPLFTFWNRPDTHKTHPRSFHRLTLSSHNGMLPSEQITTGKRIQPAVMFALNWIYGRCYLFVLCRYYLSKFSLWFRTAAEGIQQIQSICYWLEYHRMRVWFSRGRHKMYFATSRSFLGPNNPPVQRIPGARLVWRKLSGARGGNCPELEEETVRS